jgi:hypothetical protein
MLGVAPPRLISQAVLVVSSLVIGGAVGVLITNMIDDGDAAPGAQVHSMVIAHPADPEDAISGLVRAFEGHSVVAIGESHNISEAGEFYNSLVASDRFARVVDAIVVEFGNARHQEVVDDYVSGKSVSRRLLTRVWRDTTQIGSWDAPMYEAFFRAVRAANANRPVDMRLRVLLGDPSIDWSAITSRENWEALARGRERFMARLIQEEVIDKDKSALVIAGLAHVTRRGGGVTDRLEDKTGQEVYVVAVHLGFINRSWQRRIELWNAPALVDLAGTWIGRLQAADKKARNRFDALLYLGSPGSLHLSVPSPRVYRNDSYWSALRHRMTIAYGKFSESTLFGAYSAPIYPEAVVDTSDLDKIRAFADCMRAEGVESFPDPKMSFDSFGVSGSALERARDDPDFNSTARLCARRFGLPPPPP